MRFAAVIVIAALVGPPTVRAGEPTLRLLTRDGKLHALADGPERGEQLPVEKPTALVQLAGGRLVVLDARGLLIVDRKKQKRVPGAAKDVRDLAPLGGRLAAVTASDDVVAIDPASGNREPLGHVAQAGPLATDGDVVLIAHGREVTQVGGSWGPDEGRGGQRPYKCKLSGRPIALAASDGRVFAATKEGPLVQLDRATGRTRDLGGGAWFNVLAMQATATRLYVLTTSGKVWAIDFTQDPPKKQALAFDGWQMAIGLVVSR